MSDELARLPTLAVAHLRLVLAALVVALSTSIPLGVLARRSPALERLLLGGAAIIQTIPALALLAFMVPALAALALPSIGLLPAFIGLTLYGVLPILRNTVTGLEGVDGAYVEAARATGMTRRQRLLRVELPLALPVIVAGVRTATVWTVGMATLSTPIGAPSLGDFIFRGLQTRDDAAVLVGCAGAAALALVLDGIVRLAERGLQARRRAWTRAAGIAAAAIVLIVLVTSLRAAMEPTPLRVGSKSFTEQYVLAAMLTQQIEDRADSPATVVESLGSTVAFDALVAGDLDVYVDYTGTLWATVMHREDTADRATVLSETRAWLARTHRVTLVAPLGFENGYALAMRTADARARGLASISALARQAPTLVVGGDYELFGRAEWQSVTERYGLRFAEERAMDPSLMYRALAQGEVDVIGAYGTDGRIDALDLTVLEDDRAVFPPYDAVILARPGLAESHPEVMAALRSLEGALDAPAMRKANAAVDAGEASPEQAARQLRRALR